ncbi:sugar phosphate isomerase/epimerase family protein [Rossellomorea aquimaris]|uniref:sugar phosphate isomerase/epimerase family protein n=1 Tax=Bacillaceae TaxID=186817 RepID=UPI0021CDACFB|nr:sugar phosphate isomerase/epimerase family protein [Bacillus sp. CH30_1T]
MIVKLTGFADEISPEMDLQLSVLESEDIHFLELRSLWGKNVVHLNDQELRKVKGELRSKGIKVSAIGSPIGKIGIHDDFEKHLKEFDRIIHTAHYFNTRFIRIFSFFIPESEHPSIYRDEVIGRMKILVKRAEEEGVILLHENEKGIYGSDAERCLDLLTACQSPNFRAAFDPANFVQCGVKPFTEAYPLLEKYIKYVHVKDALFSNGMVVPAGKGDGQLEDMYKALYESGYTGFMSLEPHLAADGTFSGFSGPELFRVASKSLKELLYSVGAEWK